MDENRQLQSQLLKCRWLGTWGVTAAMLVMGAPSVEANPGRFLRGFVSGFRAPRALPTGRASGRTASSSARSNQRSTTRGFMLRDPKEDIQGAASAQTWQAGGMRTARPSLIRTNFLRSRDGMTQWMGTVRNQSRFITRPQTRVPLQYARPRNSTPLLKPRAEQSSSRPNKLGESFSVIRSLSGRSR